MREKGADRHGSGVSEAGSGDAPTEEPPSCENDLALINIQHVQAGRVLDFPVRKDMALGVIWAMAYSRLGIEPATGDRLEADDDPPTDLSGLTDISLGEARSRGLILRYRLLITPG